MLQIIVYSPDMTSLQSRERRGTVPRNSLNNGPSYIIHFGVDAPMDGSTHTQATSLRHRAVSIVSSTAALRFNTYRRINTCGSENKS